VNRSGQGDGQSRRAAFAARRRALLQGGVARHVLVVHDGAVAMTPARARAAIELALELPAVPELEP
jgi:hypothetical protein